MRRIAPIALHLAGLACALAAPVAAALTVNRCVVDGAVLYTDQPCAKATPVDVDAGSSAPDATERLRRDQQALDQRAAARRDSLAREAALARMEAARAPELPPAGPSNGDDANVYDFAWSPLPVARDALARRQDRRDDRRNPGDERERRRGRVITQPPPTPLRAGR
jgi:hypothetical protein